MSDVPAVIAVAWLAWAIAASGFAFVLLRSNERLYKRLLSSQAANLKLQEGNDTRDARIRTLTQQLNQRPTSPVESVIEWIKGLP